MGFEDSARLVLPTHTRSMKLFCRIDTTAFASIMVVLLFVVIFAEAVSSNPHHGVSADLPKVSNPISMPGARRENAMRVVVTRDGNVYFGVERVRSVDLAAKIQDRLKDRGVERKVYITADARARYGLVKQVLEGVRSAGIVRVAFLVDQRRFPVLTP